MKLFSVLAWDIAPALVVYYGLRLTGQDEYVSLLAGSLVAAARVGWVAARHRRLEPYAMFLLAILAGGLVLSLCTGDARFLLLKESFGTGAAGVVVLATCFGRTPIVLTAVRGMVAAEKAREIDRRHAESADYRRAFSVLTAVWGAGLIVESLARVPLVWLLPPDAMALVSQVLLVAMIVALSLWTARYAERLDAKAVQ